MSDDEPMLVVVQIGSTHVRCGLSGDDAPRRVLVHAIDGRNPVSEGVMPDPDDFVITITGCVGRDLDCATETRGIIVCDPPTNTQETRKVLAAVLFETFHFPAVLFYTRTPLCALSACRTTGLVIEFGDEHTYVMPVVECSGVRSALQIGPIAGRQISKWLVDKVAQYNPTLVVTAESLGLNEIGSIKRQCPVAPSRSAFEEMHSAALAAEKAAVSGKKTADGATSAPPAAGGSAGFVILGTLKNGKTDEKVHEIVLPPSGILAAAPEPLFQPHLLDSEIHSNKKDSGSLAQLVVDAISAVDPQLHAAMYANVVIAGRGSMFPGLADRLEAELRPLAAEIHATTEVSIVADDARSCAAWVGASILSSMRNTEQNGFVTQQLWNEYGPTIFDTWSTE